MATVLKHWREAATLILVSPKRHFDHIKLKPANIGEEYLKAVASKSIHNFDVLLLKRSKKATFMPNLYVFPGGVASDADFNSEWVDIFRVAGKEALSNLCRFVQGSGPGAPMFSRDRSIDFSSIPSELAFRICAIRETFEESGVLLARNINHFGNAVEMNSYSPVYGKVMETGASVVGWRERVETNPEEFISMCKELNVIPDVWSLYEWANHLTPIHASTSQAQRRYDTAFFVCCVEEKPTVVEDNKETIHSQWSSPMRLLRDSEEGLAGLATPQVYELSRLLGFSSLQSLHQYSWRMSHERVQRSMTVHVQFTDDAVFVMPGDDLYPDEPDFCGDSNSVNVPSMLEESNRQYPRHHRIKKIVDDHGRTKFRIICNVALPDKRVPPCTDYYKLIEESIYE